MPGGIPFSIVDNADIDNIGPGDGDATAITYSVVGAMLPLARTDD